uniref:Uncharacterized protein n=1 Tax=Rhinopithecus roxellana TaxID=61622 RepID=A0A2K6PRL2_RHIRO
MLPALQLSRPTPGAAVPVRCPPPCTWHSPDCQSPGRPHLHHVPGPALALTATKRHAGGHSCLSAAVPRRQLPPGTWGLATIAQRRPVPREGSQPTQGHTAGPWMGWMRDQEGQGDVSPSREAPASPPPVGPVRVAMVTAASIHFLTQGPCTARTAFGPTNGHWLWSQVPGLGGHQEGASQACEGHRPCIYPAPAVTRQSPAPPRGSQHPLF